MLRIVIPTFNRGEMVSGLIHNLNELGSDIEVVVVDDCSDSQNKNILKKIVEKKDVNKSLRIVFNQRNTGGAGARNVGAKLEGEYQYLWFIDDDDLILTDDITKFINFLKSEKPKLVFLNAIYLCEKQEKLIKPEVNELFEKFSKYGHQVNTSCSVFSKDLYDRLSGWDSKLVAGQDTDILLRASRLTDATNYEGISVKVIEHDGERITTNWKKQMLGKYQFITKNWEILHPYRRLRYILTLIFIIPYFRYLINK